ncbi:uncharacterized protein C6orf136 homolog [Stigmatopora argus]
MAVSRRGVAFWVGCVRIHGRRPPINKHIASLSKPVVLQWINPTHPLSSASWALAPPNSLRYESAKQVIPSQHLHHANWSQRVAYHEEYWEDSLGMCVLVRPKELSGEHTTVEFPLFAQTKLAELLAPGNHNSSELSFLLTTVDGSREDDISINSFNRNNIHSNRKHGCFRSLFEAERCPAPYIYGSQFYCFHSPGTELIGHRRLNSKQDIGLKNQKMMKSQLHPTSLCSYEARTMGPVSDGDSEEEQKLALAYERLRTELPNFFRKNHDYTMYTHDLEFINGLLNIKTRGRVIYQLTLLLWRLMCLFYFADARLEVLKLTKHMEDRTIKARWRLNGLPFITLMLRFYRKDKSHLYRSYDAFSTFYIGNDGLIHCHKVEKVMPAQPPVVTRVTSLLASALVALGLQENRPALNLLPLLLSSLRQVRD